MGVGTQDKYVRSSTLILKRMKILRKFAYLCWVPTLAFAKASAARDDGMDANDKLGKLIDGFMEHEAPMNQNNPLKHKESIPWQSIK